MNGDEARHDKMASALSPTHRIVLSSKDIELADSVWQHAKSPSEAIEILKKAGVDEAIIGGGRAVALSFMREKLVDFMVIDLQPIVFGVGTSLFGDIIETTQLKLLDSRFLNENALRLRYQVLRDGA